jgi:hypothetical protein
VSLHILNDFEKPANLCDPVLSRTCTVNVEHCDSLNVVFVRSIADKQTFDVLVKDITAYFENDGKFTKLFLTT